MFYKIYPIYCSAGTVDQSLAFYHGEGGKKLDIQYACFLLKSEAEEWFMVDSGCPLTKDILANHLESIYSPKQNSGESMEMLLKPYGVRPEDIRKIFFTHLHYDHAWNLWCYPNAEFYAQRKEMQEAVAPFPHLVASTYALSPETMKFNWLNFRPQFIPLDGETEPVPGIRCIPTPGHSTGSQTILVSTRTGVYACCGDYAIRLESIYNCRPVGLLADMGGWYSSYTIVKKLLDEGVKFLPTHDPEIMKQKVYG